MFVWDLSFFTTATILFALGAIVGSFLNVLIYRTVHDQQFVKGRSRCPRCNAMIAWYDNIPILSFLLLRRRCRSCFETISWTYPVVEILTGALFVWWFLIGFTFFKLSTEPLLYLQPIFWLTVGTILIVVFFTDLLYGIIPDVMVALLIGISLAYRIALLVSGVYYHIDFSNAILGSALLSLALFGLFVATKGRGFGFGDVKFMFPLGLLMGWPEMIVGIWVSFVSGGVVGVLLLLGGKKKFGQTLPFGPFMIFGTIFALLFGSKLAGWYLSTVL